MVDLNQVVIDGDGGLYERLCEVADHRKARGIRHELASVLLVCAAAMLSGCHNPTEIAEWAKNLDEELLGRLHARRSPRSGRLVAPSLSTIQRVLWAVERDQLDAVVHEVVVRQLDARRARIEVPTDAPEETPTEEHTDDDDPSAPPLRAIAVDGKSLRGAVQDDGRPVHLLAACVIQRSRTPDPAEGGQSFRLIPDGWGWWRWLFGCALVVLVHRCRQTVEPGPDGGIGGGRGRGRRRMGWVEGWGVPCAVAWGVAVRSVRLVRLWAVHGSAGAVVALQGGRLASRRWRWRGRLGLRVRQRCARQRRRPAVGARR